MSIEEAYETQREFEEKIREEIASMLSIFRFEAEISKAIKGRSGIMHEVDIVAEKKDDHSPIRLLIKCKSPMEETFLRVDEVLCFWAQILDAAADGGMIITTCKISEAAIKFAEHHRILIITGRNRHELRYKILQSKILGLKMIRGRESQLYNK